MRAEAVSHAAQCDLLAQDGGVTWTTAIMGRASTRSGDGTLLPNCYFAKINPILRHMGWGEPAVGPGGLVHYAYAGKGSLSTGDIFYVRSTDNGSTWSAPVVLNVIQKPISINPTGCPHSPLTTTRLALRSLAR